MLFLSRMRTNSKTLSTTNCHDHLVLFAIWTALVCGLVLRKTSLISFTVFLKSLLVLSGFPWIFVKSCISFLIWSWHWTHLREKTVPVAIASLNGVNIKTGAMCSAEFIVSLEMKQQGAKIWQMKKSWKSMHASFPSNIQPINAVHMAYKTLGSWQNMVGRVLESIHI